MKAEFCAKSDFTVSYSFVNFKEICITKKQLPNY